MRVIGDEIVIEAPPQRVWEILTDFGAYPAWNPFIQRLAGRAEPGERLQVRIVPPGKRGMTFKPRVLTAEAPRELAWLGHLLLPGLVDGEHRFELERLGGDRTRFVQRETFRGLFVPLLGGTVESTLGGFRAMNGALKRRAESQPG